MMSRTTYTSAPSVQVGKLKQNRLAVSPRQRRKGFRSGEAKSELGRCCWNLQPKEILIPSAKRLFQQHRSKREAAFFWIMSASAGSGHSGRQANAREVPQTDILHCGKKCRYSITSSASARAVGGIARSIDFAVFRLMTKRKRVGCSNG